MGIDNFTLIPNGLPCLEDRVRLLYTYGVCEGKLNIHRFVEVASTNAARLFGIFPQKGTIAVGSDADIVVVDPTTTSSISAQTHHMNVDYSCFEGMELTGAIETVISRGTTLVAGGEFLGSSSHGRYLRRGLNQLLI